MVKLSTARLAKECASKGAKRIRKRSETVIFSQRPSLVTKPEDEHLESSTEAKGKDRVVLVSETEEEFHNNRETSFCNGYLVFTCGRRYNENTHTQTHTYTPLSNYHT